MIRCVRDADILLSYRGMEQSDDRQQFSLLTNDVAPRTFQCATVSDARYWLFCVQRSILHKAKAAKIPGYVYVRARVCVLVNVCCVYRFRIFFFGFWCFVLFCLINCVFVTFIVQPMHVY